MYSIRQTLSILLAVILASSVISVALADSSDCYLSKSRIVYCTNTFWFPIIGFPNLFSDGDYYLCDNSNDQCNFTYGYGSNGSILLGMRETDNYYTDFYKRVIEEAVSMGAKSIITTVFGNGTTVFGTGRKGDGSRDVLHPLNDPYNCLYADPSIPGEDGTGLATLQTAIKYAHDNNVAVIAFRWPEIPFDYVIDADAVNGYFEMNENFNPLETWLFRNDFNPSQHITDQDPNDPNHNVYLQVRARENCPDCVWKDYWVLKNKVLLDHGMENAINFSSSTYRSLIKSLCQYLFSSHADGGLDLDGMYQDHVFYNPFRIGDTSYEALNSTAILGRGLIVGNNPPSTYFPYTITKGQHHTHYAEVIATMIETMRTCGGSGGTNCNNLCNYNCFTKGDQKIWLQEGYYHIDDYKYFLADGGYAYPCCYANPCSINLLPDGILGLAGDNGTNYLKSNEWYYGITGSTWSRVNQLLELAENQISGNVYNKILLVYGQHHANHLGRTFLQDSIRGGVWDAVQEPYNRDDVKAWLQAQWPSTGKAAVASKKVIAMHYIRHQAMANGDNVEELTVPGHESPDLNPLSDSVFKRFVNQEGESIEGAIWPGHPFAQRCGIPINGVLTDWPYPYWGYASSNIYAYQNCSYGGEFSSGYKYFGGDWTLSNSLTIQDFDRVCAAYLTFLNLTEDANLQEYPPLTIPASEYWKNNQFYDEADGDGVLDDADNCPTKPNGDERGTCIGSLQPGGESDIMRVYGWCNSADECTKGQYDFCEMNQRDNDSDGIGDVCDNCPNRPNGPTLGTCVMTKANMKAIYRIGDPKDYITCTSDTDCISTGGTCQMEQGDCDDNGIGDVDECYANFDSTDRNVNTFDLMIYKWDYGRIDCKTVSPPCEADANKDGKVNLSDLGLFKNEYGRIDCPALP